MFSSARADTDNQSTGPFMQLAGWGRFPRVDAELIEPPTAQAVITVLKESDEEGTLIARGAGRSYGDSSLNTQVLSSRFLDSFSSFDEGSARLRCSAGVTIDELLKVSIPKGLFPAVVPGTKQVSIGGAIAADIHGKNHHRDGSFCDHVESLTLALASGEIKVCSTKKNKELFHATCGGMGLTGVILDATVNLEKVPSVFIRSQAIATKNLNHTIEQLEALNDNKFVVAWVDCLATGDELGRGIVHAGNFTEDAPMEYVRRWGPSVPFNTPSLMLNRYSMSWFNNFYYWLYNRPAGEDLDSYDSFFFPLDSIKHWNRLYGRKGFLQYQFLLPEDTAQKGTQAVLERVADAGKGSFLAVLKKFGAGNSNLLSFPGPGLTLTLDFKNEASLFPLLDELDKIVIENGGRHYLAKDARLSAETFKAGYPQWAKFKAVKDKVDPQQRFSSLQSQRIGLTTAKDERL
ncbi:MAG: FAD-binding oxidoreductase [Pseudomonadales bacterium]|nr:FAD-binding oxidoreductase [Pseudomonadales bacterium]